MKVKDLFEVISKYEDVQIINAKSGRPLTSVDYLEDSGNELWDYEDRKVYGISACKNLKGESYLSILVTEEV